jgi:flavin-dependent dehydrogenase
MEAEFECDSRDAACRLWFSEEDLAGYSWYVPKGNRYLNIGIGGKSIPMKTRGKTIQQHWERLVRKLSDLSLLNDRTIRPRGYNYYLRQGIQTVQQENAFIIGDAAGLATRDMGEGIGPAVKSGILAAGAILHHTKYTAHSISKYSVFDLVLPWRFGRRPEIIESHDRLTRVSRLSGPSGKTALPP